MKGAWLVLIAFLLIISSCKKTLEPEEKPVPTANLYFSTVDYFNKEIQIKEMDFSLNGSYKNEKGEWVAFLQTGSTKGENTALKVPQNSEISFMSCVNNDDYYQKQKGFLIGNDDLWITTNCIQKKKPNITFEPRCLLKDTALNYVLNLSVSEGGLMGLALCEKHSSGIDYVSFQSMSEGCESGWSDCAEYDSDYKTCKKELPLGTYKCLEELENCESILGIDKRICIRKSMEIPDRLRGKVNSCYNVNINLIDKSIEIPLSIKTNDFIKFDDFIKLYLVDEEYTKQGVADEFQWGDILWHPSMWIQGRDNGMKDIELTLSRCGV